MNILDIAIAKQLAGGGGGSGTDNYNDLSNLPKINDTTLSGNKSSSALGLQSEITSDNKLDSDLISDADQDNKFVTSAEKNTWNAKQNAIDADHKINADYVDDSTSTNKFVTASDKEAWNAKQSAIDSSHKLSSDLVDDANHTNKFVTTTEKNTWNAKQNAIDSDHKLSSSLVSFSTAEAAALASGIDSAKVSQISTNQTNILYALQTGVKNLLDFANLKFKQQGSTVFTKTDTYITTTSTNSWASTTYEMELPAGTYVFSANISDLSIGSGGAAKIVLDSDAGGHGTRAATIAITQNGAVNGEFTWGGGTLYIMYYPNYSSNVVTTTFTASNNMICTKAAWDQEPNVYRPFALPNYDLTRLEAEDRAALAEEIDAGAKNKCNWAAATVHMHQACSYTKTDSDLTIASTTTDGWGHVAYSIGTLPAGNYTLSVKISSYSAASATCKVGVGTTAGALASISGNGTVTLNFTKSSASDTKIYFYANYSASAIVNSYVASEIMVCTKAAFGVSQKFVPYSAVSKVIAKLEKSFTSTQDVLSSTGCTYNTQSNKMYRITGWASYSSNPIAVAIVNSVNGAVFGYAEHPSGLTNARVTATAIVIGADTVEIKAKYSGSSTCTVGMIVEEIVGI